jgi:hypothetical protein
MAASVAAPLERQLSTISGLDSITSTSQQGSTQITLQFVPQPRHRRRRPRCAIGTDHRRPPPATRDDNPAHFSQGQSG